MTQTAVAPHTRRYMHEVFLELCRIDSTSGRERGCAERVRSELAALGIEVAEDSTQALTGSDSGNLLARIPARGRGAGEAVGAGDADGGETPRCVLLCAHLDTVPALAPLEPELVDGVYENANEGILGADNKAAVAVILALTREIVREGAPVELELLFTVAEEVALAGARAFDASALRAEFGYVFDHATPIGEVIVASP